MMSVRENSKAFRYRSYRLVQRKDKCGPVITRPAPVRSLTSPPSQTRTGFHWTPGPHHPATHASALYSLDLLNLQPHLRQVRLGNLDCRNRN
jgi:hypothetical protein